MKHGGYKRNYVSQDAGYCLCQYGLLWLEDDAGSELKCRGTSSKLFVAWRAAAAMQLEQRELGRGTTGPKDVDKTVVVKMVTLRGNWILQDAMKMWMGAFVETRTTYTTTTTTTHTHTHTH